MTEGASEDGPLSVGKASARDQAFLETLQEILHPTGTRFRLEEEMRHSLGHVWWARVAEDPAGYLVARMVAGEAEILHVEVAAGFRNQGVGTALLGELLKMVELEKVFLEVREGNVGARKLYAKLGFEVTGRREGYYAQPREDAVLMMWQRREGERVLG